MKKILLILSIVLITGCGTKADISNKKIDNNQTENKSEINDTQKDNNTGIKPKIDNSQKDNSKDIKSEIDDIESEELVLIKKVDKLFNNEKTIKVNDNNYKIKFVGSSELWGYDEDIDLEYVYTNVLLNDKEILAHVFIGEYDYPYDANNAKFELSSVHGNIMIKINFDEFGSCSDYDKPAVLIVINTAGKVLIEEKMYVDYYKNGEQIAPVVVDDNSIILNRAGEGRTKYILKNGKYEKSLLEVPSDWNAGCGL